MLVREAKKLRSLRPPAGEQQAFSLFVDTLQKDTDALGKILVFPEEADEQILKDAAPLFRLGNELAHRLGASTCQPLAVN
jgi:hypothetical protein